MVVTNIFCYEYSRTLNDTPTSSILKEFDQIDFKCESEDKPYLLCICQFELLPKILELPIISRFIVTTTTDFENMILLLFCRGCAVRDSSRMVALVFAVIFVRSKYSL